ncbi:MAG: hypothetical protein KAS32_01150 [Candidatus Peribacteraceae bacterium]|nr:hypothetical protein [Candidatus Peribacteraceae bacterium]
MSIDIVSLLPKGGLRAYRQHMIEEATRYLRLGKKYKNEETVIIMFEQAAFYQVQLNQVNERIDIEFKEE